MKALGLGCFWFASRRLADEETFEPKDHIEQIRKALESVDNVSDVDLDPDYISVAGWSFYPDKYGDENFFPSTYRVRSVTYESDTTRVLLEPPATTCKARDRRIAASAAPATPSCCAPSESCCAA